MTPSTQLLQEPFAVFTDVIAAHAAERGVRLALTGDDGAADYVTLEALFLSYVNRSLPAFISDQAAFRLRAIPRGTRR